MRNNRILKVSIIVAIMTIMLLCLTNNVFAADQVILHGMVQEDNLTL